jgi:hypothetical protein
VTCDVVSCVMRVCRTFEEYLVRQVHAHLLAFEQFNDHFINMNYLVQLWCEKSCSYVRFERFHFVLCVHCARINQSDVSNLLQYVCGWIDMRLSGGPQQLVQDYPAAMFVLLSSLKCVAVSCALLIDRLSCRLDDEHWQHQRATRVLCLCPLRVNILFSDGLS